MKVLLVIHCILLSLSSALLARAAYPTGFNNHTGCLYTYLNSDHPGQYKVILHDAAEAVRQAPLGKLNYDTKSACITTTQNQGKLVIEFETADDWFYSMSLEMQLSIKHANWEITKAILTIAPVNSNQYPSKSIDMRPVTGDIYAPLDRSYSCSSLVLVDVPSTSNSATPGPQFKITLNRFQLQPFPELARTVFAPSRDCSTWLTMPQIMGFILVLFMIFSVLIGVYLLSDLGSHSSDLRFSKLGGMLMNQAQLDATKAD